MTSGNAGCNSDWLQFYEQTNHHGHQVESSFGFSDTTVVATNNGTSDSPGSDHQLSSPSGCVSKPPARRRSRAAKKKPTTLLNANASNFRALVQQFTGCPSTSVSLASRKGPVNLNFGSGTQDQRTNQQYQYYYHQQTQPQLQQQERTQQQVYQPHQNDQVFASASANTENSGAFFMDDADPFHDLTRVTFPSNNRSDHYFL